MKVSIKKGGACRQILTIDVPAEAMQAERDEILGAFCKTASLPGFRRGRAPRHLVEKKFSREIGEEATEHAVSKYYHQAIEQESVQVVQVIDVTDPQYAKNGDLEFQVTVDVRPEFKLPKIEGIPIKAKSTAVDEKKVDETVESIRRRHADHEEVEGRAAQEGDLVQVSYEATIDGAPLEEKVAEAKGIGRGTGYWVSCDDDSFLPGLGKALIGAKIGDTKEVPVSFPKSFIIKELSEKKAIYKVEVTGMRELRLPALDEEFLKKLQVETVDELRTNIREHLERAAENDETARQENAIFQYLLQKTKLDVPETDCQKQLQPILNTLARRRIMEGQSEQQIKEQREELIKEAQEKAEEQVKLRYIVAAAADELQVDVNDAEISSEIVRMAVQRRQDAADLRKQLEKEKQMDNVREQVRFNKTLDRMRELAKIK